MADLSDRALTDPDKDLLAVAPAAERLARLMTAADLPYTVGIYGEWGEGKTTFAGMVAGYLSGQPGWEQMRLVQFSAWPYVTADAVWRALLDAIARMVYEVQPAPSAPVSKPVPESARARLRGLLLTPVVATPPENPADEKALKYERLMQRLGRVTALAARSTKDTETARQVSLLAGLVLDVVSAVAAPVGPLRRVLGLGSETFGSPGLKASPAEQAVASVEEARSAVRDLFADAAQPRTVIIVDDLDRCMPEVALDVLETIKIFLSESTEAGGGCAFIVAVDQSILTRALHTRLGVDNPVTARAYLEKVIQFGVSMSAVRSTGPGRLVAAQYPQWNGAIDLLSLATDANPRRLKQQCELLSYGYALFEESL